ncbi:class C sortase [Robinsoniella peoriensis]|uniref:Sortase n=1 Tax=Robinsoniella peoriensis TaxID=180332 RepID=A0A4U8Q3L0_9FIRM|nr:class C sortase [Robinsoniella peoriensis]TLC99361.1 sortase [Robinsoniella peoriensis]
MKRIISIVVLLLLGMGFFLYPHVSNLLMERNQSYAIQNFEDQVKNKARDEMEEEWKKAEEYNESLSGNVLRDPFMQGSGMVLQDNYKEVLNINGIMGYIDIPDIDVNLAVYHGTGESTLKKGVGHLEGTSLPVGGAGTHAVFTGHTGLTTAKLFTDLTELGEGDMFYLHILDRVLAYQVDQIKVVEPENTDDLKPVAGKDYVTLVTCTPYGVNSHRLLVRGKRTDYHAWQEKQAAEKTERKLTREEQTLWITGLTTAVIILLIIITAVIRNRKKGNER